MRLDNPNIQKWQYQQGPLYKKESLESAVSEIQEHHCLFCKKPIDHYHHVVPQHKNGSNTIGNIVGLCAKHHDLVHKDSAWEKKLAKKSTGLYKKYGALGVLNQIIPTLTNELSSLFPKHSFVTNGKSTYDYRAAHGVSKDHWLDAYCIACSVLPSNVCDSNINNHISLFEEIYNYKATPEIQKLVDFKEFEKWYDIHRKRISAKATDNAAKKAA